MILQKCSFFCCTKEYSITFVGYTLIMIISLAQSWPSPTLPKLFQNNTNVNPLGSPITISQSTWLCSWYTIGALVGLFPMVYLADKIGRKKTILLLFVPHIIAYLLFAFTNDIRWYYFGRYLTGFGSSPAFIVLPIYLSEISTTDSRGMLVAVLVMFEGLGFLFPYVLGHYLSILWFNTIVSLGAITFGVLFQIVAVESPHFYVLKHRNELAEEVLLKLGVPFDLVPQTLSEIMDTVDVKQSTNIFMFLRSKNGAKSTGIVVFLKCFQQLTGVAAIFAYTEMIFMDIYSNVSPNVSSIVTGCVMFASSLFGPFLIERIGRKPLLIYSLIGLILFQVLLGVYYKFEVFFRCSVSWLPLALIILFISFYNLGYASVPVVVTTEILPSQYKLFLSSVGGVFNWGSQLLVLTYFNSLNVIFGKGGTMWFFSFFSLLSLAFTIFVLPETKGKSFVEIQKMLNR